MTKHKLENSEEVLHNTHADGTCKGEYCTIHNMSDHHMRYFAQHWRRDRGLMERICKHGVGHPDPDDPKSQDRYESIHGCDGCCDITRYTFRQSQDTLRGDEKQWSENLTEAVKKDAYNCDCQVGGVDAISIDTDWLEEAARAFSRTISVINKIRGLHKPYKMSPVWTACEVCRELPSERGKDYPCATIRILEGEQK